MTLEELRDELETGTVRSLYLIVGPEPLLRDEALAAIHSTAIGDASADFDFDRLEGDRTPPGALLDAVRTLPVLAPRRLVLLREPAPARGAQKGLAEALAEAASELGAHADAKVVLVVVAEQVDRRARWVRAFGAPVACEAPRSARELARWARGEAQRQGVELGRGVADLLAERTGPHLLMLRQEIAKAALLAGEGEGVTRSHVIAGACDVAEEPIWDLTDAIGDGRTGDALAVLSRLRRAAAPPPVLLGSLVSHFRKLLRLRSGGDVAAPPFVRRKLQGQSRRYTERRLLACLDAIHQTDTALKGAGTLPPETALERLVIALGS